MPRNELSANVWNMYFDGIYNFKLNDLPFEFNWGGKFQIESVTDNIKRVGYDRLSGLLYFPN